MLTPPCSSRRRLPKTKTQNLAYRQTKATSLTLSFPDHIHRTGANTTVCCVVLCCVMLTPSCDSRRSAAKKKLSWTYLHPVLLTETRTYDHAMSTNLSNLSIASKKDFPLKDPSLKLLPIRSRSPIDTGLKSQHFLDCSSTWVDRSLRHTSIHSLGHPGGSTNGDWFSLNWCWAHL